MSAPNVLLIGTLDTKGTETHFVRDLLVRAGVAVTVVDAGVRPHGHAADVRADEVFRAAGTTLDAVRRAADRGQAVTAAAKGAARIATERHGRGLVDGVLGLGGSAGTTIATAAMRALPFGVPKLMVSTLASGQVRPYVGVRDVLMLNAVVDVSGLNRISRTVFANAAAAMAGMVRQGAGAGGGGQGEDKTLVTATMFGVTTPCV